MYRKWRCAGRIVGDESASRDAADTVCKVSVTVRIYAVGSRGHNCDGGKAGLNGSFVGAYVGAEGESADNGRAFFGFSQGVDYPSAPFFAIRGYVSGADYGYASFCLPELGVGSGTSDV